MQPIVRKTPRRLKKNRRKSKNEPKKTIGKLVRSGLIYTCRICGEEGHNKRRCPNKGEATAKATKSGGQKRKANYAKAKGKEPLNENVKRLLRTRKPTTNADFIFYSGAKKGITIQEPNPNMVAANCKRKAENVTIGLDNPAKKPKKD
ncbi:hypothetical protein PTKIN_Ptkin06aG0054000 [Pterospermum kingtungense]